ncbi:MAG: cytidine deaminase [Firmicutes bacterium]|nr:cytidine deaminase [Bacillota bacterium]
MDSFSTIHDPAWDSLLEAAWRAWANAYAPYSHFHVGAALLCRDGSVHLGCNVENASYGGTICAERTAICAAAAQGMKPEQALALVVVTEAPTLTPPCGLCRQVIAEFSEDLPILLANRRERALYTLSGLLPHAFTGRNLQ